MMIKDDLEYNLKAMENIASKVLVSQATPTEKRRLYNYIKVLREMNELAMLKEQNE